MNQDQTEQTDQQDHRGGQEREEEIDRFLLRRPQTAPLFQINQSPLVSPSAVSEKIIDRNSYFRTQPSLYSLSPQMGSAGTRVMIKEEGGKSRPSSSHLSTLPFPSSSSSTSSSSVNTRADAFMASLLRAASSDKDDTSRRPSSPMSVSSIVDPNPTVSTSDSPLRLNKRKSSSYTSPIKDQESLERKIPKSEQAGAFDMNKSHHQMMQPYDRFAELYHKLANFNPAAVAARSNSSTPFQPKPLFMSISSVTSPNLLSSSSTSSSSSQRVLSSALSPIYQSSESDRRLQHQQSLPRNLPSSSTNFTILNLSLTSPRNTRCSPESSRDQMRFGSSGTSSSLLTTPSTTSGKYSQDQQRSRSSYMNSKEEEQKWAEMGQIQRLEKIQSNILSARRDFIKNSSSTARWPPNNTAMSSIRCCYANIAQKSYGSEKRFLCPPPVVKIDGPLRSCRWACARVVSGDSPTPSSISIRSISKDATAGEEEAILDAKREARFGKLHVASLSESRGKTFRLQINLLRSEGGQEDIGTRSTLHDDHQSHPSCAIASGAWSTFHTAPISVISKPARKSAKTRAASPAIASGSIVCLYNRLNSQTVRTKYLAVESMTEGYKDVRRLIARQDGWEGFAIDLLARPLQDASTSRSSQSNWASDGNKITYGCIVCLRDINANVCSDPMLICKVEKGKVDISCLTANSTNGKLRFQIVGENRDATKEILLGGTRRVAAAASSERNPLNTIVAESSKRRESTESSNESTVAANVNRSNEASNTNIGGAVIQMQKVILMHVTPRASKLYSEEFECDLTQPRPYLCSTAFEGVPDNQTSAALVRSRSRLQVRMENVEQESIVPDEEEDVSKTGKPRSTTSNTLISYPVGFVLPPTALWNNSSGPTQVDMLEDPFCWTIVTISQSEVSFLEANLPQSIGSPLIPYSPLPITPFPSVAAAPLYDGERHSVVATIHDFNYSHDIQNTLTNNVCTMGSASMNDLAHEIWLGHSGPLQARSTSAGPYMSDVTIQLPTISELLALHNDLHGTDHGWTKVIRLPILFVRSTQGITFVSGHWLQGTNFNSDTQNLSTWEFSVK